MALFTCNMTGGSARKPVGSPVAGSRWKKLKPGIGSFVSLVTPASASACELTQAPCPSMPIRMTGVMGQIASRSSLRGPVVGKAL